MLPSAPAFLRGDRGQYGPRLQLKMSSLVGSRDSKNSNQQSVTKRSGMVVGPLPTPAPNLPWSVFLGPGTSCEHENARHSYDPERRKRDAPFSVTAQVLGPIHRRIRDPLLTTTMNKVPWMLRYRLLSKSPIYQCAAKQLT